MVLGHPLVSLLKLHNLEGIRGERDRNLVLENLLFWDGFPFISFEDQTTARLVLFLRRQIIVISELGSAP